MMGASLAGGGTRVQDDCRAGGARGGNTIWESLTDVTQEMLRGSVVPQTSKSASKLMPDCEFAAKREFLSRFGNLRYDGNA
jgi:hypothetical protein